MPLPKPVAADPLLDTRAADAARRYLTAARALGDRSAWPLKMFTSLNLFLWHIDAFAKDQDPVPLFAEAFGNAAALLEAAASDGVSGGHFPAGASAPVEGKAFEDMVSGLFSDVWVGMTDDIYFDQSYEFTKERFEKNGLDPEKFFGGKVVVDAGCGSGKFSAAIAKFGAAKVIGLDIGDKGLDFAREQAKKVPYGDRLDFRHGSLLDMPLEDGSVDIVWSNGVIHHTLGYEKCVSEFARVLKPEGRLFLYVNGRFGLFELLLDTLRLATEDVPRNLFQHFLNLLGINSGRIYWIMDCLYAPYEWKGREEVEALLRKHGFSDLVQLTRGVAIDQIEQVTTGLPFAKVKYGDAQLKYLATKA